MRKKILVMTAVMTAALVAGCSDSSSSKETTTAATTAATTSVADTTAEDTTAENTTAEDTTAADTTAEDTTEASENETTEAEGTSAMSYAEYVAAEDDDEVVIEAYVQAKQSWWDDKATVYLQDQDGAYFAYNMVCSEEDYAKLTEGTKIRVSGYKTTWSGEVEIAEGATFEFVEDADTFVAEAKDVTDLLGTDELINSQNQYVAFKGMTVSSEAIYKWDGSGSEGDDLYFNVKLGDDEYTFTVESYLCGKDTDVYKAVQELKVDDVIDMTGFLYWYEGVNPHITSVAAAGAEESAVMSYDEYMAAEEDDEVVIEAYVQAKQSWWDDKATVYLQDQDGAYFAYNMVCSEDDYAKLTEGTKIRVSGYKAVWAGEVEIAEGSTFEFVEDADTFVAEATDVTEYVGTDDLADYMNQYVAFTGLEVVASNDDGAAYLYKWDGSGSEGDDLYFNVSNGTNTYSFTVESYLCGADTDVYKAVKELKVGDKIDMKGFLYWYEGANPHITEVTVAE